MKLLCAIGIHSWRESLKMNTTQTSLAYYSIPTKNLKCNRCGIVRKGKLKKIDTNCIDWTTELVNSMQTLPLPIVIGE